MRYVILSLLLWAACLALIAVAIWGGGRWRRRLRERERLAAIRSARWEDRTTFQDGQGLVVIEKVARWGHHREVQEQQIVDRVMMSADDAQQRVNAARVKAQQMAFDLNVEPLW